MITLGNNEITKAFLGSAEVKKICLGNEHVWPMVLPYDEYGYINKGKVLHLDGIDKGDNANAWTDLVQGLVFNIYGDKYGKVTQLAKGFSLPGYTGAYLCASATTTQIPNNQNATVEACFKPTAIQAGFIFAKFTSAYSPMFFICADGDIRGFNSASGAGRRWGAGLQANQNYTASIEYDKSIVNGEEISLDGSTAGAYQMESQQNYARIGSRRRDSGIGTGQDLFKGTVYSIRIYDHKLTSEEILHNQKVDNERFNLGLTFPETI